MSFDFGNPHAILAELLNGTTLPQNELGHTILDDFEHFCAYTGCTEERVGKDAFAWAKLAYLSAANR